MEALLAFTEDWRQLSKMERWFQTTNTCQLGLWTCYLQLLTICVQSVIWKIFFPHEKKKKTTVWTITGRQWWTLCVIDSWDSGPVVMDLKMCFGLVWFRVCLGPLHTETVVVYYTNIQNQVRIWRRQEKLVENLFQSQTSSEPQTIIWITKDGPQHLEKMSYIVMLLSPGTQA